MSPAMEFQFEVVKASAEEVSAIQQFVHDNFLPDVPMLHAFGVDVGQLPPPRTPDKPAEDSQEFSLKAVNSQGETVGVVINKVSPSKPIDANASPERKQLAEFLSYVEEKAELNKLPEKTIELRVVSVLKEWRQRGVARRLAEESMRVARENGFQAMRMCCVSEYSARLASSLGWREHYRLAYKDYARVSGREVSLKPTPPHEFIYYYTIDL